MSDTAVHALHSYVAIEDPNNLGTYIDVTEKCSNVANAFSKDNVDTSTFGQGDKTNIGGMRDGTFRLDYFGDSDMRDLLFDIFMSDDPVNVRYGPEGNSSGDERQSADFNMEGFEDGGSVGSAIGGSVSFHRTGATTRDTF